MRSTLFIALAVASTLSTPAQDRVPPSERLRPFHFMVGGSWEAKGTVPGFGPFTAHRRYRWALDSAFIEQEHSITVGPRTMRAIGYLFWDEAAGTVGGFGLGDDGGVARTSASITDTVIVFDGTRTGGFNPGTLRGTFVLHGRDRFTETVFHRSDGRWVPSLVFEWSRSR